MTDIDEVWPLGSVRNDIADALILLEFIDAEILTPEFIQAIDPDLEQELFLAARYYQRDKKVILEAVEVMRKEIV